MKHPKFLLTMAVGLSVLGSSAFAGQFEDRDWHSVLVCDQGAAVVDNQLAIGRGGAGALAQIVIRDPNIIRYFNQAGVVQSSYSATEWIGQSFPEMQTAGTLLNFPLSNTNGSVKFDGNGLLVNLGLANWYFRNCFRQ